MPVSPCVGFFSLNAAHLLTAFAAEYQAIAPLRYQELAPGLNSDQAWQKLGNLPGAPARERIPVKWFIILENFA